MVGREPEWDDRTREQHLALVRYDRDCCPGCGLHKSILDDPEHHVLTLDTRLCQVCRVLEVHRRTLADDERLFVAQHTDPKTHESTVERVAHPHDGAHHSMRFLTPAEIARRRVAQPTGQPRKEV